MQPPMNSLVPAAGRLGFATVALTLSLIASAAPQPA